MRKPIAIICLIVFLTVTACMGTHPRPVETFQYGDDRKSCEDLQAEIILLEEEVELKREEHRGKVAGNIFAAVFGILIIWPVLFLLDTKSDHRLEMDACIKRRETLGTIAVDKECEFIGDADYSRAVFVKAHNLEKLLDRKTEEPAALNPWDPNLPLQ